LAYQALYRKWRPQSFDEMVGQQAIVRTLKNQVASGRISHAYLFCGPRGTGKTTTAKIMARAINCLDPQQGNPCGVCDACTRLAQSETLDILEIDAASNNGVEEIRDLREKINYPPSVGRYRVYIIDEVHMLSSGAFNALLKTLEEPPPHGVFILATTEPHRLPATILSRCQRFDFERVSAGDIATRLTDVFTREGTDISPEAIALIARAAQGSVRDAWNMADQCLAFCGGHVSGQDAASVLGVVDGTQLFALSEAMMAADAAAALDRVDTMLRQGHDYAVLAREMSEHLRNLLLAKISRDAPQALDMTAETAQSYVDQARGASVDALLFALDLFTRLENDLKWSTEPRILLEMATVRGCHAERERTLEGLIARVERLERQLAQGLPAVAVQKPSRAADETAEDLADAPPAAPSAPVSSEEIPQAAPGASALSDPAAPSDPFEDAPPPWLESAPPESSAPPWEAATPRAAAPVRPHAPDQMPPVPARLPSRSRRGERPRMESEPEPAQAPSSDAQEIWQRILARTQRERPSLFFMIDGGVALGVEGDLLTVQMPDNGGVSIGQMERESNRAYLAEAATQAAGRPMRVMGRSARKGAPRPAAARPASSAPTATQPAQVSRPAVAPAARAASGTPATGAAAPVSDNLPPEEPLVAKAKELFGEEAVEVTPIPLEERPPWDDDE
jgi:DNA polymerase-3 subunit gamma/tau